MGLQTLSPQAQQASSNIKSFPFLKHLRSQDTKWLKKLKFQFKNLTEKDPQKIKIFLSLSKFFGFADYSLTPGPINSTPSQRASQRAPPKNKIFKIFKLFSFFALFLTLSFWLISCNTGGNGGDNGNNSPQPSDNTPPAIEINCNYTTGSAPLENLCQANASDPESGIKKIEWDCESNGTVDATGEQVTCVYNEPERYTVIAYATNGAGLTSSAKQTIEVTENNLPNVNILDGPFKLVYLNFDCNTDQDCYDYFYPEPDADTWRCDAGINKCVSPWRDVSYLEPYRNTKVYFAPVEVSDPDPDDTIESVGWEQILNDPNYMAYQILDPNPIDVLDGVSVVIPFLVDSPETGYGLGKYLFRAFASDGYIEGYDDLEVKVLNRVPKACEGGNIGGEYIFFYCHDADWPSIRCGGGEDPGVYPISRNFTCTNSYDPDLIKEDGNFMEVDTDSDGVSTINGIKFIKMFGPNNVLIYCESENQTYCPPDAPHDAYFDLKFSVEIPGPGYYTIIIGDSNDAYQSCTIVYE